MPILNEALILDELAERLKYPRHGIGQNEDVIFTLESFVSTVTTANIGLSLLG